MWRFGIKNGDRFIGRTFDRKLVAPFLNGTRIGVYQGHERGSRVPSPVRRDRLGIAVANPLLAASTATRQRLKAKVVQLVSKPV
jgi:hypothetical protein